MFARFFIYIFFLLIAADIYIYLFYIRKLTRSLFLRSIWFLPSVLLLGGLYFFFFRGFDESFRNAFTMTYIALSLPKIVFALIVLLNIPFRIFFKWKIYPFTIVALALAASIEFIIIYGCLAGYKRITVKEVTFNSPNLPDVFDGFRIVHVSDFHLGQWNDTLPISKTVNTIINLHPDMIAITGDLVHHTANELNGYEDMLARLKAPSGVYSVLGNHDYAPYREWRSKIAQSENLLDLMKRQTDIGWTLLNNDHVFLEKEDDRIAIIGVENNGEPPFTGTGNLPKAMRDTEDAKFKILLSHNPTHWRREVLDTDIDLTLSGHTHGSQFALGRFSFSALRYDEWGGLYTDGNQGLYVNVGIGMVGVPFRFGAFPEITLITLRKSTIETDNFH
jgi:predicted MPP superfamily phosphohydrolase